MDKRLKQGSEPDPMDKVPAPPAKMAGSMALLTAVFAAYMIIWGLLLGWQP